jgi:hypothetical protein
MNIDFGPVSEQVLTFRLIVDITIIRFVLWDCNAESSLEISLG